MPIDIQLLACRAMCASVLNIRGLLRAHDDMSTDPPPRRQGWIVAYVSAHGCAPECL